MRRDFKGGSASAYWKKAVLEHGAATNALEHGYIDCAVSRSYYSLRHAATSVLLAAGVPLPGHRHGTLIRALGLFLSQNHPQLTSMGRLFHHALTARNDADYASSTVNVADARTIVEQVGKFLSVVKKEIFPSLHDAPKNETQELAVFLKQTAAAVNQARDAGETMWREMPPLRPSMRNPASADDIAQQEVYDPDGCSPSL